MASEEERAKAKHLAKQLEEKDRVIKKQDAFYKEQLARLEERSSEFYKVTTEQYQKAAEEVEAKFKRYEYHPVCADLQARILQCYRQNTHQTLSCSALANQYMHCVNHAKQSVLQKGVVTSQNARNPATLIPEAEHFFFPSNKITHLNRRPPKRSPGKSSQQNHVTSRISTN